VAAQPKRFGFAAAIAFATIRAILLTIESGCVLACVAATNRRVCAINAGVFSSVRRHAERCFDAKNAA
jgi:hypothetical protein